MLVKSLPALCYSKSRKVTKSMLLMCILVAAIIFLLYNQQIQKISREVCSQQKVNDTRTLPVIYVITPTYVRSTQYPHLTSLAQTLMLVPNIHWIIVEDSREKTKFVTDLLHKTTKTYTHLNITTTAPERSARIKGLSQRNLALKWIKDHVTEGIIYFADDDNNFSIELFHEIRKTSRIGILPTGEMLLLGISSPIVKEGRVIGFVDCYIEDRKFPVDMASIAINVQYWLKKDATMFSISKKGYMETVFLESIGVTMQELEPLADNCTKVLVWHTQSKTIPIGNILINKQLENSNIPQLLDHVKFNRDSSFNKYRTLYKIFTA